MPGHGKFGWILALGAAFAVAGAARAQSFFQDFNTLPSVGASSGWNDNLTLSGATWTNNASNSLTGFFAYQVQGGVPSTPALIRISDGTAGFGNSGLYTFGPANNTDRALGSFTGLQNGAAITEVGYGFRYTNNTGAIVRSLSLSYRMEQWRTSGGATTDQLLVETLYDPTSTQTINSPGYVFGATTLGLPPTAASQGQNGNTAGNFVTVNNQTIAGLTINPGESIWVRWRDQRLATGANEDGGMSIDNLTFAVSTAIPEPSSCLLVGAAVAGWAVRRRRRAA